MKRQLILLLSLIILVFLGQSALAAGASPEIKNIRVDGSSVKENETYVTQNNMVDITVEYLNAVKIKLGSEEVSVSESAYRRNYTFDDYLLKTGTNKLVIQVTGTGER